jgi:ComF family protein
LAEPLCAHCGLPLPAEGECPACATRNYAFDQARAWGIYRGELRKAILRLKHRRNAGLGLALAQPLISMLNSLDWNVDLVVPVPLAADRQRERGYNQIDLLAVPIAGGCGLRLARMLVRQRETAPQMDLHIGERWANLRGAFSASQEVAGHRVLVVDDIMTTGATMHAAARALRAAGAREVYGLALARALTHGHAVR